jgi:ABC-2 type transport system permease protein
MLDLLPWVFLFFVPAVTMRALAEDLRAGTLEVVLAQPISEAELLVGKYLGQLLFILIALALTLAIPVGLGLGADLQVGVILAQYVGAAFLALGFTGVGIWTSSLGKNQITAFIVGVAVMFVLIFLGLNALIVGLPPVLATFAANLSVLPHFANVTRGVIDLRDAIYFLTLAAVFLALAYMALMGRKLAPKGDALKRLRLGTGLIVLVLIVVNLFGRHIGGRIDLTPGKVYTLSGATKDLLGDLDDLVTVKLFVSRELPPEIALLGRDIDDLLSDFRSAGKGMVRVTESDPADDPDAASEAQSLGIPPVQFNVVGQGELQVKEGYLGMAVQYADDTEIIPLIQRTDDLEYRLASFIRSLTRESEPVIGLVEERVPGQEQTGGLNFLRQQLSSMYQVRTIDLETDTLRSGELSAVVLVGSPMTAADSVIEKVLAYLRAGGSALVMASGMQMSPQPNQPFAGPMPIAWNRLLEPYGVSIKGDMVYDLASNEQVSIPGSIPGFRLFVNYPFWLRALSTKQSALNQDIESVFMPWSSQIDTARAVPGTVTPLFTTSEAGGLEEGQAFISPQRNDYPTENLAARLVGALINPLGAEVGETAAEGEEVEGDRVAADQLPSGRIVVLGNGDVVRDAWVRNATRNIVFALNAVDWLAQDEGLIAIRSKDRSPPPLVWDGFERDFVKYGNMIGVPLLIALAGLVRLLQRRKSTQRRYVPLDAPEAA